MTAKAGHKHNIRFYGCDQSPVLNLLLLCLWWVQDKSWFLPTQSKRFQLGSRLLFTCERLLCYLISLCWCKLHRPILGTAIRLFPSLWQIEAFISAIFWEKRENQWFTFCFCFCLQRSSNQSSLRVVKFLWLTVDSGLNHVICKSFLWSETFTLWFPTYRSISVFFAPLRAFSWFQRCLLDSDRNHNHRHNGQIHDAYKEFSFQL